MFSFTQKVDRNDGQKDLPQINDLKKTALFFGALISLYLVFKTVAPIGFVGFRRQNVKTPQIQLVCGLRSVQQLDAVMLKDRCV